MDSEYYTDFEINEPSVKLKINEMQRSKHKRFLSDTLPTNCCTIEIERPSWQVSSSNLQEEKLRTQRKKILRKTIFELPERLNSLKQITENKIKFLKVEKDLKELEECTFKPKTNVVGVKSSILHFSKQQQNYLKAKNSGFLRLTLQQATHKSCKNLKTPKKINADVHERLYKASKLFVRHEKPTN